MDDPAEDGPAATSGDGPPPPPPLGPFTAPVDHADPRFVGVHLDEPSAPRPRRLVRSAGPGSDGPMSPAERRFRVLLPLVFFAAVAAVALVFFLALRPGPQQTIVGPESAVEAAVAQRPKRVCFNDNNPCAWLTVIDERLVAFNTSGSLPQEFGRDGVGWCASSGYFGANATGSRYDPHGTVVSGPAPRGLDRFRITLDGAGRVVVDWLDLRTGRRAFQETEVVPPAGPHCDEIPFDREADLDLAPGP